MYIVVTQAEYLALPKGCRDDGRLRPQNSTGVTERRVARSFRFRRDDLYEIALLSFLPSFLHIMNNSLDPRASESNGLG